MYLGDEACPDLGTYFEAESLALVPLGSTEQHGPPLPEATDHSTAEAFAREAAERPEREAHVRARQEDRPAHRGSQRRRSAAGKHVALPPAEPTGVDPPVRSTIHSDSFNTLA